MTRDPTGASGRFHQIGCTCQQCWPDGPSRRHRPRYAKTVGLIALALLIAEAALLAWLGR